MGSSGCRNMSKGKIDFDAVRDIALTLPNVEDGSTRRGFAVKVKGRLLACEAINKSAEPGSLVVRIAFDEREELLELEPDVFYLTDHYVKHAVVLVRLSKIERDSLRDLLERAWHLTTAKKPRTRKSNARK